MSEPQFFSVSENSVTVSFGNQISIDLNRRVLDLEEFLKRNPFPGLIEIVPAYSSLTVFYDLLSVKKNSPQTPSAFSYVKNYLNDALEFSGRKSNRSPREIEILFDCREEYALDLEKISELKGISKTEIIEIFTSQIYRVFMLGFLPGFAYMGEVDDRISVPRKGTPRLKVPKGSVGIAGNQTGIYPLESPGGWQIIGKTDTEMFTPNDENPAFFRAGDLVKFIAIK